MELVGISEIATLAATSRSAVSNWIARDPSFPKPLADLACGQIWDKVDIEDWLKKNSYLTEDDMNSIENLEIGHVYTHDFICKTFGGDAKGGTYLPQKQLTIVCGCFTTIKNPEAPECVLVGSGPKILGKAERLANQGGSIPVFLKTGINQWVYKGRYEFVSLSRNTADFEARAVVADRNDVVAALFFRKVIEKK